MNVDGIEWLTVLVWQNNSRRKKTLNNGRRQLRSKKIKKVTLTGLEPATFSFED
jgi:hypothetical protein